MFLEDILRTDNFNEKSRDQLLEIIYILRNETLKLKSIHQNQYDGLYNKINQLNEIVNIKNKEIEDVKKQLLSKNIIYKKIVVPLTLKERITGKFDIKKLNKQ